MNGLTHDQMIEKIRKVMALSQSPNENEAAAAAQMAQELLVRYNIDISEVKDAEKKNGKPQVGKDQTTVKSKTRHQIIRNACCKMYFCTYYFIRAGGGQEYSCIIGEPHNVAVAKMMTDYLIKTTWRLAQQSAKQHTGDKKGYVTSFANACSNRIAARIYERIEQSKVAATVSSDGRNLPALAPMYNLAEQRNKDFLDSIGVRLRTGKARSMKTSNWQGALDGRAAGDSVGLDPQVGGGSTSPRLTHG